MGKVYDGKTGLHRRHCSWDGTACHARSSLKGSPLPSSSERTSEVAMYSPVGSNPTPDPRQLVHVMCGNPCCGQLIFSSHQKHRINKPLSSERGADQTCKGRHNLERRGTLPVTRKDRRKGHWWWMLQFLAGPMSSFVSAHMAPYPQWIRVILYFCNHRAELRLLPGQDEAKEMGGWEFIMARW